MARSISVVICAYSEARWPDLVAAVESLRQQTCAPHEIVAVADHNRSLFERVRTSLPDVVALESSAPRGLSGARNSGLAAARGAIVAFLDDDAVADPTWLERLAHGYDDPRALGVGGAIEPLWDGQRPPWMPSEFDWVVGCTYRGLPACRANVRNLIGTNMSFWREPLVTLGGFRVGLGRVGTRALGCEETELCIRARQQWPERQLVYEPRARVYHRVPAARAGWGYFRSRTYCEGLSKAQVSEAVGARDGLSAERAYLLRTLPDGVRRGLSDALLHGDAAGLARAGAIVAGLTITMAGYAAGAGTRWLSRPEQHTGLSTSHQA